MECWGSPAAGRMVSVRACKRLVVHHDVNTLSSTMQTCCSQAVCVRWVPFSCCCPRTIFFSELGNPVVNQHRRGQSLADLHWDMCSGEHVYERFFCLTFSKRNKAHEYGLYLGPMFLREFGRLARFNLRSWLWWSAGAVWYTAFLEYSIPDRNTSLWKLRPENWSALIHVVKMCTADQKLFFEYCVYFCFVLFFFKHF